MMASVWSTDRGDYNGDVGMLDDYDQHENILKE